MKTFKRFILPAILMALVIFLGYLFTVFFEKKTTTVPLPMSSEARRNPYLAAEFFLRSLAVDVKTYGDFNSLDELSEQGMILLTDQELLLTPSRIDEVFAWVKKGGHLVVNATNADTEGRRSILDRLDIELKTSEFYESEMDELDDYEGDSVYDVDSDKLLSEQLKEMNEKIEQDNEDLAQKEAAGESQSGDVDKHDEETQCTTSGPCSSDWRDESCLLIFPFVAKQGHFNLDEQLEVKEGELEIRTKLKLSKSLVFGHPLLEEGADTDNSPYELRYGGSNKYGYKMLVLGVGQGQVTALAGDIFLSRRYDRSINEFDHAYYLAQLSPLAGQTVLLIYASDMPSLFKLLVRYALPFMICGLLLLFLWLWSRGARFGSIHSVVTTQRRSLGEHVIASAKYWFHNQETSEFLRPLREDVIQLANHNEIGFSTLSQDKQIQALVDKTGLSSTQIELAMFSTQAVQEFELVTIVNHLQFIRQTL
ncbi:MAG: DUF4350 domain-containing protein [Arenicella sp.]